jgi:hypothetical protein
MPTQVVKAQETSVYDDIPEFGGPNSVGVQLKDDNKTPATGDFIKDGMPGSLFAFAPNR